MPAAHARERGSQGAGDRQHRDRGAGGAGGEAGGQGEHPERRDQQDGRGRRVRQVQGEEHGGDDEGAPGGLRPPGRWRRLGVPDRDHRMADCIIAGAGPSA